MDAKPGFLKLSETVQGFICLDMVIFILRSRFHFYYSRLLGALK